MKTLILLLCISVSALFIAAGGQVEPLPGKHTASYFADTLESGSSDSLLHLKQTGTAKFISFQFRQLDTFATWKDSLEIRNLIKFNLSAVDFKCCSDSSKRYVDFTYSGAGQERSGYVNQPGLEDTYVRMTNQKYFTNRRVYVEATIIYY